MRRETLSVRPGFVLLLTVGYMLDREGLFELCMTAALLHELGHLAAVRLCGGTITRIILDLDGGWICHRGLNVRGEAVTALAGPAVNLLTALVCAVLPLMPAGETAVLFAGANMALGLYNLLPVRPLDGGRFWEILGGQRLLSVLELPVCVGFLNFGLYICLKTRYNGTVLCAGLVLTARVLLRYFTKERMI